MGVIVTDRKYGNKYKPEIVNWLIGNVGDWQELKIEAEFTVEKIITLTSGVELIIGNIIKNMDGKEWSELGFDIGDTIHMTVKYFIYDAINDTNQTITLSWSRNILNIQGDEMTVDGSDITVLAGVPELTETGSINRLPYQNSVGQKTINSTQTIILYTDKRPQGIELQYGHLDNDNAESTNLASFIDGTKTKFIAINTDTTASGTMQPTGMQSGMSVEDATWTYKSKTGHTYKYEFLIRYMISSFFEDTDNLANREAPTQVFDANSLTDNLKVIGYPTYNNPNTKIQSDLKATKRLGNTGWFGENFNGLKNDFEIKSVQYFDEATNEPLNALSYGAGTKVVARIGGIQNLSSSSKFSLGFIWTPEEEEYYKSAGSSFHKNLLVNTAGAYSTQQIFSPATTVDTTIYNGFSTDNRRMDVKNVKFEIDGADIVYEAVFVPTIEFKNFMRDLPDFERNYVIWISVADHTLETNFSNRVSLLLDYQQMEVFIPPVGGWRPMVINFGEHPDTDVDKPSGVCRDFFIEDDVLARVDFRVDKFEIIPNAIEFAIELENINTGENHKLQSYNVNLTNYPAPNGEPQWNYEAERGFKYEAGNNKNWVKVKRNPSADLGQHLAYKAFYGFKLRWEDWIGRPNTPNDFYDANEPQNGLNNNWWHLSQHPDWKLQFTVNLDAVKDGDNVRYVNSEEIHLRNYDDNPNITKEWNFYRESDNQLLNAGTDPETGYPLGVLLEDEKVRVETIWRRILGEWDSLNGIYATSCVEVDKGAGQFEFRQLSSVIGSESDNPLEPLAGETNLKLTLLSPKEIKAECLIEPSKLINATRYKHSARLGCLGEAQSFITEWDTTQEGVSASDEIALPLVNGGSYNFKVYYNGQLLKHVTDYTDRIIQFPDGGGVKEIEIYGEIKGLRFGGGGDCLKLIREIKHGQSIWGTNASGTSLDRVFLGCSNLLSIDVINWDVSMVTSMRAMLQYCFNFISPIDFSDPIKGSISVTNISGILAGTKSTKLLLQADNINSPINTPGDPSNWIASPNMGEVKLIGMKNDVDTRLGTFGISNAYRPDLMTGEAWLNLLDSFDLTVNKVYRLSPSNYTSMELHIQSLGYADIQDYLTTNNINWTVIS